MSGPQFHQTRMGQMFYEYHVPQIAEHLASIASELKRANDLKEQELNGEQKEELDTRGG